MGELWVAMRRLNTLFPGVFGLLVCVFFAPFAAFVPIFFVFLTTSPGHIREPMATQWSVRPLLIVCRGTIRQLFCDSLTGSFLRDSDGLPIWLQKKRPIFGAPCRRNSRPIRMNCERRAIKSGPRAKPGRLEPEVAPFRRGLLIWNER